MNKKTIIMNKCSKTLVFNGRWISVNSLKCFIILFRLHNTINKYKYITTIIIYFEHVYIY